MSSTVRILEGDCLSRLCEINSESVQCVVTSPPYWGLRDYGVDGQIGLEETPDCYVRKMVSVFREVSRVLRKDGTLWLNLGDSYAGSWGEQSRSDGNNNGSTLQRSSLLSARQIAASPKRTSTGSLKNTPGLKPKDLVGIPWRVAFALQEDGWYLRQDIIWSKPNPLPESVRDRCTKSHEYIFLFSKSERYFYDADSISEPCKTGDRGSSFVNERSLKIKPNLGKGPRTPKVKGGPSTGGGSFGDTRNKRSVWEIPVKPFKGAHFATFPPEIPTPCILAGSRPGDTVLDPFGGAGTTGLVALRLERNAVLIEINPDYARISARRIRMSNRLFGNAIIEPFYTPSFQKGKE